MRLRHLNHPTQALWKQLIVGVQDLAVHGLRRCLSERDVMILYGADECVIGLYSDPRVLLGIALCDGQRPIRAAIVDDEIVPVRIRLREDALDALRKIFLAIVDWGQDADYGRSICRHAALTLVSPATIRALSIPKSA
jgi:hypothetical protein